MRTPALLDLPVVEMWIKFLTEGNYQFTGGLRRIHYYQKRFFKLILIARHFPWPLAAMYILEQYLWTSYREDKSCTGKPFYSQVLFKAPAFLRHQFWFSTVLPVPVNVEIQSLKTTISPKKWKAEYTKRKWFLLPVPCFLWQTDYSRYRTTTDKHMNSDGLNCQAN